ncbi:hypothetical protein LPTSP4_05000 [Leptospira ryugenii]|uniref:Uncharacterized protein n=1 Tax=Leptospira ryugenii TaxID=1917863 RepID=A0A2P2DWI3_9LEPT|nr:hypothetical protein [Leptospira ryugenii]GBF48993.1 hypothetical protein LPTSP4_05000 [Leptospira ryugenii]
MGTVIVRCPVCYHSFQFNSETDKDFKIELETPSKSFSFQPSKQEYLHLLSDLLYAPIDFLKSKIPKKQTSATPFWKEPKQIAAILLYGILFLYIVFYFRSPSLDTNKPLPKEPSEPTSQEPRNPSPEIQSDEPVLEI